MTRGSCCTSAGRPSAILRPNSIATTLSRHAHHHRHVVLDEQHGQPELVADAQDGVAELVDLAVGEAAPARPSAGTAGWAARPRAISSRLSVPNGRPAAGRNISVPETELVEQVAGLVAHPAVLGRRADPADRLEESRPCPGCGRRP